MRRKRTTYTTGYKKWAVDQIRAGKSAAALSRQTGIRYNNLVRWMRTMPATDTVAPNTKPTYSTDTTPTTKFVGTATVDEVVRLKCFIADLVIAGLH